MFKSALVSILLVGIGSCSAQTLQGKCNIDRHCSISDANIGRNQLNYNVAADIDASEVEHVTVTSTKLAILNTAFCDNFPILSYLRVDGVQLKVILEAALKDCQNLQYFAVPNNALESIPSTLFNTNPELQKVDMSNNKLFRISTEQFKTNTVLTALKMNKNKLADFSVSAIEECTRLEILSVQKNDLRDLDVKKLIENKPDFKHICAKDNQFSQETIKTIRKLLKNTTITFHYKDGCEKVED